MAKFNSEELRSLQSWQKHLKQSFNKIDKLNTTLKYWNTKGHLTVLKTHLYILDDIEDSLKHYRKNFLTQLNKYRQNEFGLSEKTDLRKTALKKKRNL